MNVGSQTTGLNFWDHGSMVAARFRDLMQTEQRMNWVLPTWFIEHAEFIRAALAPDQEAILEYQQWHDLGKPYCRMVDADGKVHYPNHAEVSANIWISLAERTAQNAMIGDLIRGDMICHTLRPADALSFASNPHALHLLSTALCELHANSAMFGGTSSDSFKIKFKRLSRCGSIILSALNSKETS